MSKEMNKVRRQEHIARAQINVFLEIFGDDLASKNQWNSLDGIEALHYYLMQKHHWTPAQLREMSYKDLQFALHQEMQGWTAPKDAL
ncbi:hypothetical protein [Xylella fastidiosa]|uniref:hypothetical protein n=1 Tax=Xylella fastidiosa TaxID=2371 RepID=UPI001E3D6E1D|nr:hypothetical protein [Xylella fastidiosa]